MKILSLLFITQLLFVKLPIQAQNKDSLPIQLKKIDEIITNKAIVDSGLINIYVQEGKYFFEIPQQLLHKDILLVSRLAKGAVDVRDVMGFLGYGGDEVGESVIQFDTGPNNKLFIKQMSYSSFTSDSTHQLYKAISNSSVQPIIAAFDIKALSKDMHSFLIDMSEFINGENETFFIGQSMKNALGIGGIQQDKSYIQKICSYSNNIEIRTVKTFARNKQTSMFANPNLSSNTATFEFNSSLVLLPQQLMKPRRSDERVGYFKSSYTDFESDEQQVEEKSVIKRWRLEPKDTDLQKYRNGELVEPKKPIVFYIDPATPKKWIPYLTQGVNDWQKAFEQAGFKNAIYAREAPLKNEDSTWSLEDSRYSAIVYKASSMENASGPIICDPRTGEILESHINWYHNVMKLAHDWYFIQSSQVDQNARKATFDDSLMGRLIRFVVSHEVGHSIGLMHNFGSSSTVPVDSLRKNAWLQKNGICPSIMDYARFNYIAQPGDQISKENLFPRIGEYDKWAIEWGYKILPSFSNDEKENYFLNQWITEKTKNRRLWFGSETSLYDPRSQAEDLGDDPVKASLYGIKNLQYILPNLISWTKTSNGDYSELKKMYNVLKVQLTQYFNHVSKLVGGEYWTPKTIEQKGPVFEIVPRDQQKLALDFLDKQLFLAPEWLLDKNIILLVGDDPLTIIKTIQNSVLDKLLSAEKLTNMVSDFAIDEQNAYSPRSFLSDIQKEIWAELTHSLPINVYRRNLQKHYIADLEKLITKPSGGTRLLQLPQGFSASSVGDTWENDISSIVRGQLKTLYTTIKNTMPKMKDQLSIYHLHDCLVRINEILNSPNRKSD